MRTITEKAKHEAIIDWAICICSKPAGMKRRRKRTEAARICGTGTVIGSLAPNVRVRLRIACVRLAKRYDWLHGMYPNQSRLQRSVLWGGRKGARKRSATERGKRNHSDTVESGRAEKSGSNHCGQLATVPALIECCASIFVRKRSGSFPRTCSAHSELQLSRGQKAANANAMFGMQRRKRDDCQAKGS
eukprot:6212559-Pleurochrysis_carterae.AAC.1